MTHKLTKAPLRLTVDWPNDHLMAVAYGQVVDGKPQDEYVPLTDTAAFVLAGPEGEGELIGFFLDEIEGIESAEGFPELWDGPEFHVPELGLNWANAGAITAAALAAYPDRSTLDAYLFHQAIAGGQDEDEVERNWRLCLAAGDLRAHYGLGYTLCGFGRHREAYAHLRYYTELLPCNAWAWCWLGHACAGIGDRSEARSSYERALELESDGSFETNASECLQELEA